MKKEIIAEVGWFLTGSAVYGPLHPGSDLDIVCSTSISMDMKQWATEHDIVWYMHNEEHTYEDDPEEIWYMDLFFTRINFIVLTKEKYQQWKQATDILKRQQPIIDRAERVSTFAYYCQTNLEAPNDTLF